MAENYTLNFHNLQNTNGGNYMLERAVESPKNRILFIGEERDLFSHLETANYATHLIPAPKLAIKWLKDKHFSYSPLPAVIILQTEINGFKTFDYVATIKSISYLKNLPIIFITDKHSAEERDEAIRVGADDYFISSIQVDDLTCRIDFLCRLQELYLDKVDEVGQTQKPFLHNKTTFKMWTMKRAFDILVSGFALLLLSPILIILAIAVKLDSKGPVFYISKRAGKGYQIFNFYKFRSMRINADAEVKDLMHLNQYAANGTEEKGVFFKVKNDPRITKLGSILRKTSLDELPQLFNVLKGDMSMVGNRPLPLYEAEKLTQDQWALRFLAPAGITGLWQITKRGKDEMSEEERVSLDMKYATENSFWYDLKIMIKTPQVLLQKEEV